MASISRPEKQASACLFGLAFGDALGAKTEFLQIEEIIRRFPPNGPQDLPLEYPARVTDDTQMTIAVGLALLEAPQPYSMTTFEPLLREKFLSWYHDPENNRAPGITCLSACELLDKGHPWYEASIARSKGCGTNMRVAPVGLLTNQSEETRAALAQFQAGLTHGHPTGLAASDLTAFTITTLLQGAEPAELPRLLQQYAHSQRTVYHQSWLGPLWQKVGYASPQEYIARGWDECLDALDKLDEAVLKADPTSNPCQITGEGWIAEEALMTALLCFLLFPTEPVAMLQRAAVSSGDSDSIACIAGAFAGAYLGMKAWPTDWFERIEYHEELAHLGQAWDK